jgi:DNA-binding transcriptional LysR family regulator
MQGGIKLIFYPEQIGDVEPKLARALEHMRPLMTLPVWLVSHQKLRTSARVRFVFDFLSNALKNIYGA